MPRLPSSAVAPEGFFLVFTQAAKGAVLRGKYRSSQAAVSIAAPVTGFTQIPLGVSKIGVRLGLQEAPRVLFSASPQRARATSHRRLVSFPGLWEGWRKPASTDLNHAPGWYRRLLGDPALLPQCWWRTPTEQRGRCGMDRRQVWRAVLGELEISLSQATFETWFRRTALLRVDESTATFVLGVPSGFAKIGLMSATAPNRANVGEGCWLQRDAFRRGSE